MIGTILNVSAIVFGGVIGLTAGKDLSPRVEHRIKMVLGVLTIYVGMKTVWQSINGSFFSVLKQVAIVLFALILGNVIGKGLRLQKQVNKLGEYAKNMFAAQTGGKPRRF